MKIHLLKLIVILACTPYFGSAQIGNEKNRRKLYNEYFKQVKFGKGNPSELGNKMLANAQNDYEKSLAYYVLGDAEYKKGDYLHSVKLLEQSKNLAKPSDTFDIRMSIFSLIIPAYRRAGLVAESDENWKQMKTMAEKKRPYFKNEYLIYMQAKIYDIDKEYCKAADTREEFLKVLFQEDPTQKNNYRYLFSVITQLCYVQLKCGETDKAKKTFKDASSYLYLIKKDTTNHSSDIVLEEFNLMNAALLALGNGEKESSQQYFEKAYQLSKKKGDQLIIKLILEERLNADVDAAEDQLRFSKIINEISKSETTVTKGLADHEVQKSKTLLEANYKKIWYVVGAFSSAGLLGLLLVYRRNKRQHSKYLAILDSLKNPSSKKMTNDNSDEISIENVIKNSETEDEIVKNLVAFENKHLYTTKGISLAQMSVMLKTNTKYLNYVLKKYRNSDFYNYINTCRIEYIVKRLHDEPMLLHYKISVLSDICGFASHSQFTSTFKAVKDISPSQYIKFLQDKHQQAKLAQK